MAWYSMERVENGGEVKNFIPPSFDSFFFFCSFFLYFLIFFFNIYPFGARSVTVAPFPPLAWKAGLYGLCVCVSMVQWQSGRSGRVEGLK